MKLDRIRQLVYKLKYRLFFNEKINYYENVIKKNNNLSIAEIEELNWKKRKDIIEFAYKNIPFYKEYYDDNNFSPQNLIEEQDWGKVPVLTKDKLRSNFDSLKNPKLKKKYFRLSTTGGSTGEPLKILFDTRVPLETIGWRVMKWWDINPWSNHVYVHRNTHKGISNLVNKLIWFPTLRGLLDSSSINGKSIESFVKRINKIKPKFIHGYVGAVEELAIYIEKNNLKVHKPEVIFLTSAPLSESTRLNIEKVFGSDVFDQYGCSEVFWLAAECKNKKGLHFNYDLRHIEFLDSNNKITKGNEYGKIVLTDLENRVFPLIRYENGDEGRFFIKKYCECGMNLPLIDKVKGRVSEFIRTESGIYVNGSFLTTLFDGFPDAIKAFQIIQNKDFSISVNVIPSDSYTNKCEVFVVKEIKKAIKNEHFVSFNFVEEIKHDRGKTRYIINNSK
ncbi:phenylacetate--CoA ligase family protein [Aurantibacter sp.]|uniref:phenylacetate--CoA ligase family protein n=1 Tax=Aurantibacter sp. TaxID=2807103 RepID=UPI0035C86BAF